MLAAGGSKEIEARIKHEIVDRIGELQKIREIQNKQQFRS